MCYWSTPQMRKAHKHKEHIMLNKTTKNTTFALVSIVNTIVLLALLITFIVCQIMDNTEKVTTLHEHTAASEPFYLAPEENPMFDNRLVVRKSQTIHDSAQVKSPDELIIGNTYIRHTHRLDPLEIEIVSIDTDKKTFKYKILGEMEELRESSLCDYSMLPYDNGRWQPTNHLRTLTIL